MVTVFLSQADSRWPAVATPESRRSPKGPAIGSICLAVTSGSDGTRTRDLRRDRTARFHTAVSRMDRAQQRAYGQALGGMAGGMTEGMTRPKLARADPRTSVSLTAGRRTRFCPIPGKSCYDAAKESNLPSRGLPGPASFEDWMDHQARAAPRRRLRGCNGRPRSSAAPAPGGLMLATFNLETSAAGRPRRFRFSRRCERGSRVSALRRPRTLSVRARTPP